jgi:5,10-methylenetetrahydromethanopterin reductase
MRYSFSLVPDSTRFGQFEDVIRNAEADGFDIAWTPDQGFMVDPFVALSIASRITERMHLGVGVTSPYMRHPIQLARAAAALSNLSDGRFILGLGAGEKARIRDATGAREGRFVDVMRDTCVALRTLLNGERLSISNSVYSLTDVGLEMQVKHHVPLYVATTAPSVFRLAGAHADGVIVGDVADAEVMAAIVAWVEEGAISAGRTLADIDIVAWVSTVVTPDRDLVWERLRRRVATTALAAMSKPTRKLLGINEADIPELMAARRDDSAPLSKSALSDALVDRVTIVGNTQTVLARIAALSSVGVNTMAFRMPVALQDRVSFADNIEQLKRGVMDAQDTKAVDND